MSGSSESDAEVVRGAHGVRCVVAEGGGDLDRLLVHELQDPNSPIRAKSAPASRNARRMRGRSADGTPGGGRPGTNVREWEDWRTVQPEHACDRAGG
jgi:hypothetical protein